MYYIHTTLYPNIDALSGTICNVFAHIRWNTSAGSDKSPHHHETRVGAAALHRSRIPPPASRNRSGAEETHVLSAEECGRRIRTEWEK